MNRDQNVILYYLQNLHGVNTEYTMNVIGGDACFSH